MTTRAIEKCRTRVACFLALIALTLAAGVVPMQYAAAQVDPEETFTLELNNVDIQALIETVSTRTGKNFIVDPRVRATVNVVSAEPVNADKLWQIFLSVLEIHGFAAVPAGKFTKIVPSTTGVQSAVPLYSEPTNPGDELISRVIRLERGSAEQVVATLRPLLPEPASLSAQATGNTIVITDRAANIEKVIDLIRKMDQP